MSSLLCLRTSLTASSALLSSSLLSSPSSSLSPLLFSSSSSLSPLLFSYSSSFLQQRAARRGPNGFSSLHSSSLPLNQCSKISAQLPPKSTQLPLKCKVSTQLPLKCNGLASPSPLLGSSPLHSTPLFSGMGKMRIGGHQARRMFHATAPRHAGLHAFRLASFVAPIIMRSVRTWIGTPKTNAYFYRRLLMVLGLLFGLPGLYIYTHLETTPYTDRVRFVALTSDDEETLGQLAFNQLIEEHESNFIPGHHHFVTHVTAVAERIIAASNRPDIKWEVRLIDSPITNAFAIPGGKIFVFSGLLEVTENDDGLAFILGHEVAHVLARHGAEQMTIGRVMLGVSVFLSAIFGDNIGSFVLSRVISLLTELRYSRSMESEADYIGLLLMHKAKYNINEAPKVWERMMKCTGDAEVPFLSTHPAHTDRIQDISKWVEEIKAQPADKKLVIG